MTLPQILILVVYFFVLSILAIYGWHRYYLVYLYMKNKDKVPAPGQLPVLKDLPRVTIQLPIFNEMYVADRLIDAVVEMDYPRRVARDSGLGRFDGRNDRNSGAGRASACVARPQHPLSPPGGSPRFQGRSASRPDSVWHQASS